MAKKDIQEDNDGIIVNESTFSVKTLPLIVVLPEDASEAQIQRAKILNSYAYSNPVGWEARKGHLIKELKALKNASVPKEESGPKLAVGRNAAESVGIDLKE